MAAGWIRCLERRSGVVGLQAAADGGDDGEVAVLALELKKGRNPVT
jgi:hypothetical protein